MWSSMKQSVSGVVGTYGEQAQGGAGARLQKRHEMGESCWLLGYARLRSKRGAVMHARRLERSDCQQAKKKQAGRTGKTGRSG